MSYSSQYFSLGILSSVFGFVKNVTVNNITIDIGKPIKTGCKPNGCPKICQITAVISPPHIDATPAAFVTLFQYKPNIIGANRLETAIAVPVTIRLTNPGIVRDNTRATTETIKTEILLQNNILVLSNCLSLGLMISFAIEDEPAIKKESADDMTAASSTTIITTAKENGKSFSTTE